MPKTTKTNLKVIHTDKKKTIAKAPLSKSKNLGRSNAIKADKPVKITKEIIKRLSSSHRKTCERQNLDDVETFKYAGAIDNDSKKTPKTPATSTSSTNEKDIEVFSTASAASEHTRRSFPQGKVILDGATGSELDRRGADCSLPLWSANANLTAPQILKDVHKHYL